MEEIKKNRYIQGYDEKGHPVWKKRLPDDNVLTKRTRGEKILFGIVFAVFLMHCLSLLIPVVWMFFSALMTREEYVGAFVLPKTWQFSNFIDAFASLTLDDGTTFFGMIFNSIWYTGGMTALTVFMPTMTGYVMSKYKFRGRDALYTFVIFSMTVPIIGAGAATMKIYGMLGLLDSPLYVLWEGTGTSWGGMFLVYYGFFKSVSWAYAEAAEIDGAGPFTIFFRIMLPQSTPLILTYAITTAIAQWNIYEQILLYLPSYKNLSAGLFTYKSESIRAANYPLYYAGLLLSMIPTLILFCTFSNKIMTSLSVGGLKG